MINDRIQGPKVRGLSFLIVADLSMIDGTGHGRINVLNLTQTFFEHLDLQIR